MENEKNPEGLLDRDHHEKVLQCVNNISRGGILICIEIQSAISNRFKGRFIPFYHVFLSLHVISPCMTIGFYNRFLEKKSFK